jgi:hypothetical protein
MHARRSDGFLGLGLALAVLACGPAAPSSDAVPDAGASDVADIVADAGPSYPLPSPGSGFHRVGAAVVDSAGRALGLHGSRSL